MLLAVLMTSPFQNFLCRDLTAVQLSFPKGLVVTQFRYFSLLGNLGLADYFPAHSHPPFKTIALAIGKVLMPISHPQSWTLCAEYQHKGICETVSQATHDAVVIGTLVSVTYHVGRWSNEVVLDDFKVPE